MRTIALALLGAIAVVTPAFAQTPNVVIQWNQILQAQFGTAPSNAQRSLSMMHIAMFDAINAVEEAYTPYRVRVPASHGASAEAAGAQAARDVLVALYPAQQLVFDAALEAQLNSISPGTPNRAWRSVTRWLRPCSSGGRMTVGSQSPPIRPTSFRRFRVNGSQPHPRTALPRSPSTQTSRRSRS